jgi:uncharacterized protein
MTGMSPTPRPIHRGTLPVASFLLLASCAPATAQVNPSLPSPQDEDRGTIQVSGQAQIQVPADQVVISFAVETEASSAGEATTLNASRMDAVITALRGSGVSGLRIETFGYALRPEYQMSREVAGTRVIAGYRAQNNIRVTVPDVSAAGGILDRAVEAGANRVASLQFQASDTRAARLQALQEAVANARQEAEAIASAMGVTLGIALQVQGGASAPTPLSPRMAVMYEAEMAAPTPIEAGDQTVSANVSITYRIVERNR